MVDTPEVPWKMLGAVAGGVVVLMVAVRGGIAVGRVALGEVRYRANDPDTLFRWIR